MVQVDLKTRRQVYELTEKELIAQPIWEFCPDEEGVEGQDEATVRAVLHDLGKVGPGEVIVAADVTFADGSTAMGYLYSGPADDVGCIQPNVVVGTSQVNFWLGWLRFIKNPEDRVANAYKLLAKARESTFPIKFKTRVACEGLAKEVVIDGFMAKGIDMQTTVLR